jgi:hypothetical protein
LPQALQEPKTTEATPVSEMNVGQSLSQPGGSFGNLLNPVTAQFPQPQAFTDDWSFLRDFGDSTDQFYSWDVELRDLLDGRFTLEGQDYV